MTEIVFYEKPGCISNNKQKLSCSRADDEPECELPVPAVARSGRGAAWS